MTEARQQRVLTRAIKKALGETPEAIFVIARGKTKTMGTVVGNTGELTKAFIQSMKQSPRLTALIFSVSDEFKELMGYATEALSSMFEGLKEALDSIKLDKKDVSA